MIVTHHGDDADAGLHQGQVLVHFAGPVLGELGHEIAMDRCESQQSLGLLVDVAIGTLVANRLTLVRKHSQQELLGRGLAHASGNANEQRFLEQRSPAPGAGNHRGVDRMVSEYPAKSPANGVAHADESLVGSGMHVLF